MSTHAAQRARSPQSEISTATADCRRPVDRSWPFSPGEPLCVNLSLSMKWPTLAPDSAIGRHSTSASMKSTRHWRNCSPGCRWPSATPMPTTTMSPGMSAEVSCLPTWVSGSSASTFSRAGMILPPFSSGHDSPCSCSPSRSDGSSTLYGRASEDRGAESCLSIAYVTAPVFLVFGPLVLTDLAITLFSLWTLWRFAELWQNPTRRNKAWFAIALAGALLSKFSAGLLFFAFLGFSLSTRWRPVPGQPQSKEDSRLWRRARWRTTFVGVLWAAAIVYVVYFVFSWHQSNDALSLLGTGAATAPLRRLLMPPWLYLRGMAMVAITVSRPAYVLGHLHMHGIWYYFPVLFVLKSPLGFLILLALAAILAIRWRRATPPGSL